MNCRACREKLSPYLEGDLQPSDQAAVKSHLSGCSKCRQELEALRQMVGALKASPSPPVPPEFRKQVWERIHSQGWPARLREILLQPWLLKLPVGALATAAVALLVVQVTRITVPESQRVMGRRDASEIASVAEPALSVADSFTRNDRADGKLADREAASSDASFSKLQSAQMRKLYIPAVTHLRLQVKHPADAQEALVRLAAELPIQRIERPLPTRYYLFVKQAQWNALMGKLLQIGEPQPAPASEAPPAELHEADPSSQTVILDLIF